MSGVPPIEPTAFPANIVKALKDSYATTPNVGAIIGRPLRRLDPNASIGVYALDWVPGPPLIGQEEPVDAIYQVNVQALIKHMQEDEGRAQHSMFSKYIRSMVARDQATRERLAALSETSMGVIERFQKVKVRTQRFISNEIKDEFLFLSTMEILVTVESTEI